MSTVQSADLEFSSKNPLDLAEQLILDRDWLCDRPVDEELVAEVQGSWCNFRILFAWQPDQAAAGEAAPAWKRLTEREWHVLRLIVKCISLTGIGDELCLSVKTVSTYRGRVLTKLGLHSNADLVRYCLEHGLAE